MSDETKQSCEFIDSLGRLHAWLTKMLAEYPHLNDCCVFTLGGDCLTTDNMLWCNTDGEEVPISEATEVSLYTDERPYEPSPTEQQLIEREFAIGLREQKLSSAAANAIAALKLAASIQEPKA